MIELLSKINVRKLVINEARPKTGIAELLKQMDQLNRTKGVVIQAFDYNGVINRTHLFGAYINAIVAFGSHSNKTKSMPMEMLLFAAMTDQIGTAIETIGARSKSKILIFANSKKSFESTKDLLEDVKDFKPTAQHTLKALEKFGIKATKNSDALILQKMAMSRLKL